MELDRLIPDVARVPPMGDPTAFGTELGSSLPMGAASTSNMLNPWVDGRNVRLMTGRLRAAQDQKCQAGSGTGLPPPMGGLAVLSLPVWNLQSFGMDTTGLPRLLRVIFP